MKKQTIVNLVKYHVENNNEAFINEVGQIAKDFYNAGDEFLGQYLMDLISDANVYVPQSNYKNLIYLEKVQYSKNPLLLPDVIQEDILGIARTIKNQTSMSKFLFFGVPGSGKTESAYQIARLLDRDILSVNIETLIDSRLGETSKNIVKLFDEISHLMYDRVVVVFDELDALVLNRINGNDLREMGRATSTFIRELDSLSDKIVLIATTNLVENFDKAILRRFDATISFNRYSRDDLIEIADALLSNVLRKATYSKQDMRFFNKILSRLENIPYPGDMKQIIRTAVAFSDENNQYDYLRKLYLSLNHKSEETNIKQLQSIGFTTREIEIITRIPKSSVSRKLKD